MFTQDNIKIENLVIGGSLEAFWYAYSNDLPIIYLEPDPPFHFERFHNIYEIPSLHLSDRVTLRTQTKTVEEGILKEQVWQKLLLLLSLSGNNLFGDNIKFASIDKNILSVGFGVSRRIKIEFNKLIVFDGGGILGLPGVIGTDLRDNIVYDWLNVRSGAKHDYDLFLFDDRFVNKMYFYNSFRSDSSLFKDIVSISYLADEQLEDYSCSSTYVKFKAVKEMKNMGLRGARNGKNVLDPTKYKYYAIDIEPANRVIIDCKKQIFEEDERFIFVDKNIEEIMCDPVASKSYLRRISSRL